MFAGDRKRGHEMRRHELSPGQWALISDLMPGAPAHGGGRWRDHRQVVNGLFWKLVTGAQWRDIPERYGPWQTVYERFTRWRNDGLLDRMLERLQVRLDAEGRVDPELWCVDSTHVRASRSAAGGGKKGARTSRRTTPPGSAGAASRPRSTW